jgi:hypothetical protein
MTDSVEAPHTARWRVSGRVMLLLIAAALVAVAIVLVDWLMAGPSSIPIQAGYVWCCGASEVDATWVTPPLTRTYGVGNEAAWIGVQTGKSFFFQAGTYEQKSGAGAYYSAFWSAGSYGYQPQYFPDLVHPGDHLRFTIYYNGNSWVARARDISARWSDAASIRAPLQRGPASLAEWLDEDVVVVNGRLPRSVGQVASMPSTTCELVFEDLHVNGATPELANLRRSVFVDRTGSRFEPKWLAGSDAFRVYVHPAYVKQGVHPLAGC